MVAIRSPSVKATGWRTKLERRPVHPEPEEHVHSRVARGAPGENRDRVTLRQGDGWRDRILAEDVGQARGIPVPVDVELVEEVTIRASHDDPRLGERGRRLERR